MARALAIWFQQTFGNNRKFDPGPFVPPAEPAKAGTALHEELKRLRDEVTARAKEVEAARAAAEEARKAAEAEVAARTTAQERAQKAREEAAIWEALANEQIQTHRAAADAQTARSRELEEQNKKLLAELAAAQAAAVAMPPAQLEKVIERAADASEAIDIDEAATRRIIDGQLRRRGWEVDSETITFERGVRPTKGKNLAIAEWPTLLDGKEGRADYVLFAGLQVVAVVEAKKRAQGRDERPRTGEALLRRLRRPGRRAPARGQPLGNAQGPVPLRDERPARILRQLRTKSGIWFLDARRPQNHPVPLEGWYTPEGLLDLLRQDIDEAYEKLKVEPMPYIERDYQRRRDPRRREGARGGKARAARRDGDRHRQDADVHRALLPPAQDEAVPARPLPRRPQRAGQADGRRASRTCASRTSRRSPTSST